MTSGMHERPQGETRRRGIWWKSLIAAWLAVQAIAVLMLALGVDISDEFGYPALIGLWALVWAVWWRRSRADGKEHRGVWAPGALGVFQRVLVAFGAGILLIGNVVLILDNRGALERTEASAGVAAAAVAVIGVLSLVGGPNRGAVTPPGGPGPTGQELPKPVLCPRRLG